jgi:hypothetical protein
MVKNCGAWGSIAPPTTVDIIMGLFLLRRPNSVAAGHLGRENIAQTAAQQGERNA